MMTPSHREELILSHMPQVKLLAQRLHRRCPQVEFDDLMSVGTIGLIRAVDRFDPDRHPKLKTLAEHLTHCREVFVASKNNATF